MRNTEIIFIEKNIAFVKIENPAINELISKMGPSMPIDLIESIFKGEITELYELENIAR